jgi:exodeoxyribonuclease III
LKLATWNVNSLKVRLPHLLDWLAREPLDAVCLQETKTEDGKFPAGELQAAGYSVIFAGQKTYNGVAILSREAARDVVVGIPGFDDPQKRVIAATLGDLRVVDAYVPNGQSVDSDKYQYKLQWLAAFTRWLGEEIARHPRLVVVGDFNIAPEDRDVHDPKAWEGQVLCSESERAAFRGLLSLGLEDSFRLFEQPEKTFTWWDYRMNAYKRGLGLRIDHILVSSALAPDCRRVEVARGLRELERPSDHAPVVVEL